jgi:hypothetical protein
LATFTLFGVSAEKTRGCLGSDHGSQCHDHKAQLLHVMFLQKMIEIEVMRVEIRVIVAGV